MDNPRSLQALRRYWEAMALGRSADPGDLDPDLVALVQRLHTTPDVPPPDPMYASQLREHLMHSASLPLSPTSSPPFNGREISPPTRGPLPPLFLPQRQRHSWPVTQIAIVLLLIVAMVATYFIAVRPSSEPTFAPAVSTPTPQGVVNDWPMFRGNSGHNSANAGPGPVGSPIEVWTYHANGPVSRSPAVVDGMVYLQGGTGEVTALDATTGEVRWQNAETNAGENTPTVVGETLYLTNVDGQLIALDRATGAEKWRFAETISSESLPTVVDGVIYVGSEDGAVYAIDANTGSEKWRAQATGGIFRSLSIRDDVIYFGTMNGHVEARNLVGGSPIWQVTGPDPEQTIGAPAIAEGIVFAGLAPGYSALDAKTGEVLWSSAPIEGSIANAAGNGLLISAREDGVVHAYDVKTGEERWTFATGAKVQAAPAIIGDTIYAASFNHSLYALDAATGQEQWTFDLDGTAIYGPSVADGMLYIGTDAGTLYAIGGSGSEQLAAPADSTPIHRVAPASPTAASEATPAQPVALLWQYTDPQHASSAIAGISLAPDGSVWVTDGPAGQFVILSPEGNVVERWGTPGSGPGEFNFLREATNAFGLEAAPIGEDAVHGSAIIREGLQAFRVKERPRARRPIIPHRPHLGPVLGLIAIPRGQASAWLSSPAHPGSGRLRQTGPGAGLRLRVRADC